MLFAKTKLIATLNSVAHKPLVIGQSQIVVLCCLPVEAVVPDVLHVLNDIYIYSCKGVFIACIAWPTS